MQRSLTEEDKKQMVKEVGRELAKTHGKHKYYNQSKIERALDKYGYAIDIHCWAYCFFMSRPSFDEYHRSIGESCDYTAMKSDMLGAVTDHASDSWFDFDFDIDLSWLEWPDLDVSSIFDFFDF